MKVFPTVKDTLAVKVTSLGEFTSIVFVEILVLQSPVPVYVIVVVPLVNPVTKPVELTVATDGLLDVHTPPVKVDTKVLVSFTHNFPVSIPLITLSTHGVVVFAFTVISTLFVTEHPSVNV